MVNVRWVRGRRVTVMGATVLLMTTAAGAAGAVSGGTTSRVSISSTGTQGDGWSQLRGSQAISARGRYVAFTSSASNLVPGDSNDATDVFVRDRRAGVTERVSVGAGGQEGDNLSFWQAISANGRYVAFTSFASNLVAGDTNGVEDVFVRDRLVGVTRRVSVGAGGRQADDQTPGAPAISADGRYVAFRSFATNLIRGDTNGLPDVFVRDRRAGVTERVSVSSGGKQGDNFNWAVAISANGRFVAFQSSSSNLVAGDTNGVDDVFVRDRLIGKTQRMSVSSDGRQGSFDASGVAISADGRFVAFTSGSEEFVAGDTNGWEDVFLRDRLTGVTRRVSIGPRGREADGNSGGPTFSADNRYVAFYSSASNLVPGDTNGEGDIFVRDRLAGATKRVSVGAGGQQVGAFSGSISADGRHVAFTSSATNVVAGDTNDLDDVFVRDEWGSGVDLRGLRDGRCLTG
jgi:Tol biopolymer transport system component